MKLIDEKEVEEAAKANYPYNCDDYTWVADDKREAFSEGANFAEQKLQPMMVEFAEWVAKFYTLSKYGEWCSLGMPTTNTTEQLLEQFLKTKQK